MSRVLFFLLTLFLLNIKKWKTGAIQLVCSSLAFLLLYEPSLFVSESFWLSASGAVYLSFRKRKKIWGAYLWAVFMLPVLMAPILMHLFGQLSLASPIFSLFFSPLWDVVLIPLGYLSPFLPSGAGQNFLLSGLEKSLQLIASCQNWLFPWVERSQLITLRLSVSETVVLSCFLFFSTLSSLSFFKKST